MRPTETEALFESEFTYPVDCERVVEEVGDVAIEAPEGEPDTVADCLARIDDPVFESGRAAHEALLSALSEDYVGRKGYDDRGDNPRSDFAPL